MTVRVYHQRPGTEEMNQRTKRKEELRTPQLHCGFITPPINDQFASIPHPAQRFCQRENERRDPSNPLTSVRRNHRYFQKAHHLLHIPNRQACGVVELVVRIVYDDEKPTWPFEAV